MSAIGVAHIVPVSSLSDLDAAVAASPDRFVDVLAAAQIAHLMYNHSGWVLPTLLPVLAGDYAINLMESSERKRAVHLSSALGTTVFILTQAERNACADRLAPDLFSTTELRAKFEAFNAAEVPEAEEFMADGIRFLRAALMQLQPDRVVVLIIG